MYLAFCGCLLVLWVETFSCLNCRINYLAEDRDGQSNCMDAHAELITEYTSVSEQISSLLNCVGRIFWTSDFNAAFILIYFCTGRGKSIKFNKFYFGFAVCEFLFELRIVYCVLKLNLTFQGRHCHVTACWVNSEFDLEWCLMFTFTCFAVFVLSLI